MWVLQHHDPLRLLPSAEVQLGYLAIYMAARGRHFPGDVGRI